MSSQTSDWASGSQPIQCHDIVCHSESHCESRTMLDKNESRNRTTPRPAMFRTQDFPEYQAAGSDLDLINNLTVLTNIGQCIAAVDACAATMTVLGE